MTRLLARDVGRAQPKELAARDVMAANSKSVGESATVREMTEFFATYGIHVAPVIDEAGRPIGVVSRTDLLGYKSPGRDRLLGLVGKLSTHDAPGSPGSAGATVGEGAPDATAKEIMTPFVICVSGDAPISRVIAKFLEFEIRALFVTDEYGVLVGVIRVFDLLRVLAEHGEQAQ